MQASKTRPKDYIVTAEGFYFAVVLDESEDNRIFSSLRYIKTPAGVRKINTREAFDFLKNHYPLYLFFSKRLDMETVAVPLSRITHIHRPEQTVTTLISHCPDDALSRKAAYIINYFSGKGFNPEVLGITGSLMLGFHNAASDIDMLVYDRDTFHAARKLIQRAIENHIFSALDDDAWLETYKRRGCALSFEEYLSHEKRKNNKFMCENTKVDISYQSQDQNAYSISPPVTKMGILTIKAKIIDDRFIFDYPARYAVDHEDIKQILVYTATYYGQGFKDETIEARGMIECDAGNKKYMVIGTSREAPGEFIRVIA